MEAHFQDWLFRYQFIYRTRQSKQRFLRSFITDIRAIRKDVKVVAYNEKKYHSRTIYVGNITHTRKIVCTYYDIPPAYTSNYFTRKEELSTEKE